MNLLLGESSMMPFHTMPSVLFRALEPGVRRYDWVLSGLECNYVPEGLVRREPVLFSGGELSRILSREGPSLQFIWGIMVALPSGVGPSALAEMKTRSWTEEPDVWCDPPKWWHSRSTLEIVCWDSSETVLLSRDDQISQAFRRFFPEAVDLDAYNRQALQDEHDRGADMTGART